MSGMQWSCGLYFSPNALRIAWTRWEAPSFSKWSNSIEKQSGIIHLSSDNIGSAFPFSSRWKIDIVQTRSGTGIPPRDSDQTEVLKPSLVNSGNGQSPKCLTGIIRSPQSLTTTPSKSATARCDKHKLSMGFFCESMSFLSNWVVAMVTFCTCSL